MLPRSPLRRWIAAVSALLPLLLTALPALAVEADFYEKRDAWAQTRQELASATAGLAELDIAASAATVAYEAVVERLRIAASRLEGLRVELADAIAQQRVSEAANDVAIRRLGQAVMILVATEDALDDHVADLGVEVAAAYQHAGSGAQFRGVIGALTNAGSITEFTVAYEQLQSVTVDQNELVSAVTELADRVDVQRRIVAILQRDTEAAALRAREQRADVERLTTEQRTLVAQIRDERIERRQLLAQLREEQSEVAQQIESLQAQSDALTEELRQYRYVGGAPGSKDLLWPTDGMVTSGYGWRRHPIFKNNRLHAGIDIPAGTGQPIYAAADGTVFRAGPYGGYGNAVVIDHGDGMTTVYAHQSSLAVSVGEQVLAGDLVGHVGSTGFSTGPHLHFEIRLGGTPTDPMNWY